VELDFKTAFLERLAATWQTFDLINRKKNFYFDDISPFFLFFLYVPHHLIIFKCRRCSVSQDGFKKFGVKFPGQRMLSDLDHCRVALRLDTLTLSCPSAVEYDLFDVLYLKCL
jgi:hypothetical protein